jgi:hypothetical protein
MAKRRKRNDTLIDAHAWSRLRMRARRTASIASAVGVWNDTSLDHLLLAISTMRRGFLSLAFMSQSLQVSNVHLICSA